MSRPAEFDEHADTYDRELAQALGASGESKEFFARERVEWLARCLQQLDRRADSVIDYGCGIGDTAPLLREILGSRLVVGLDVSPRSLARARRDYAGDGNRFLAFGEYEPDASADVVYCNGVLHHVPPAERASAIDYIRHCLRPGGLFALWENNPWNPGTQYVMYRCAFDRDAVKISPRASAALLRGAGFEVLRCDHRFFFPRFLRALRGLEPKLTWLPLGGQYQVLARKPDPAAPDPRA